MHNVTQLLDTVMGAIVSVGDAQTVVIVIGVGLAVYVGLIMAMSLSAR